MKRLRFFHSAFWLFFNWRVGTCAPHLIIYPRIPRDSAAAAFGAFGDFYFFEKIVKKRGAAWIWANEVVMAF
jgi:hypothetical protein